MNSNTTKVQNDIDKFITRIQELNFFKVFNDREIKNIIISLLILRRFEFLAINGALSDDELYKETINELRMEKNGNYCFYNFSRHNLKSLDIKQENLYDNIVEYLDGYNTEIISILNELNFLVIIKEISMDNDCLIATLKAASEVELSEEVFSKYDMDEIIVDIYNKFSSQDEKDIPGDVVDLIVRLTFTEQDNFNLKEKGLCISDYALGIGSLMIELIKHIDSIIEQELEIIPIGMEKDTYEFTIASLRMILLGFDISHIENFNYLLNPFNKSRKVSYSTMLAPQEYKAKLNNYNEILKEEKNANKEINRFIGGLQKGNNGFYLYVQYLHDMLIEAKDYDGKASIVSTVSPLLAKQGNCGRYKGMDFEGRFYRSDNSFTGGLFYNTNICYYIWIINKNKNRIFTNTNSRKGYI